MRKVFAFVPAVMLAVFLAAPVAADPVVVTVYGEVEYNQVSRPPLNAVSSGDPVTIAFAVDSDDFMDSMSFPVRGYAINPMSFSLQLGPVSVGLQDPFPVGQTPWFVIRDNDPAVDGFYLSALTVDFPLGIPLNVNGFFGPFGIRQSVTYGGDRLSSLDILDAVGTYDYTGLTVFGFAVTDGPFDAIGIIFESMIIEAIPVDDDGDGVLNADDLCPDTMIPESVPTIRLGTNRWALVDDDLVFDTTLPPGGGPGFMFDTADTGGCSCEQIIEALYLGNGHRKFGCSNSAMLGWVDYVAGSGYEVPGTGSGNHELSTAVSSGGLQNLATSGNQGAASTSANDAAVNPGDRLDGGGSEEPQLPRSRTKGSSR